MISGRQGLEHPEIGYQSTERGIERSRERGHLPIVCFKVAKRTRVKGVYTTHLGDFVQVFNTVWEAAKNLDIHPNIISQIVRGKNSRQTFKGYTFFYAGECHR